MEDSLQNENGPFHDQQAENEIKKIKLSLEHGMDFSQSFAAPGLPPEVEGQFLDHIQQWEYQYAQAKTITIYELTGRPCFKHATTIPADEIAYELDTLMETLRTHGIYLETLCDVDEKELYTFITEEFFLHETQDIRIEGMMHCFTYEDFHPNHAYDIKNRCKEFVDFILDKREDIMESWCLADNIRQGEKVFTKSEFAERLKPFRDSFSTFTLHQFEVDSVTLNEPQDDGTAIYRIHYTGVVEDSSEEMEFIGTCILKLERDYEWWMVNEFEMPGVSIS